MRSGPQYWWWLNPYAAFLCTALLALYGIFHIFPSSSLIVASITQEDSVVSTPHFLHSTGSSHFCRASPLLPVEAKYMLYAPHSGFSNQVGELKNALLVAAILNRTLVLPPIFDHHAVALGSCPKFRVNEPYKIRALAWAHIIELIRTGRYVAIADALDLSRIMPLVPLIDLRIFVRLWCGADILPACSGTLCRSYASQNPTWGVLESCSSLLSNPDEVHGSCVFGVDEDCTTTVWVHRTAKLQSFKTNVSLWAPKVAAGSMENRMAIKTARKEKYGLRSYKEIVEALGDDSEAGKYEILSFGSLFSAEYKGDQLHVDIESSSDPKVRTLVEAMTFFPFTSPIFDAGKRYSQQKIERPFFCAQLRLLDGQFKNHWDKTFTSLKSQLKKAQDQMDVVKVLDVFVMTDLSHSEWNKTYLGELEMNKSYKVHTLDGNDPMLLKTAIELATGEYGLRSGYLPIQNIIIKSDSQDKISLSLHPDILLFIEEVICSCATLGFVGTSGSTLSANILQLRMGNSCAAKIS